MYHIRARKKRLLLICGGIQTDPVVCWQKWKGACDNMRMAALLMAMIALLGSPQGEGTVSETTWETVAVQVLEETPETAARTLLDWAALDRRSRRRTWSWPFWRRWRRNRQPPQWHLQRFWTGRTACGKQVRRRSWEKRPTGRRSGPCPPFHQASGDGDHALAGGALCLACGFGGV